jgi:RNA polymerase sigma-70 factor (ECF subfamily)
MSDTKQISDELLFIRYAEGDGNALRQLVDKYTPRLLRFCRGYLADEAEAEDAVQETFLRAIRSAGTYRATSRFSTWIHTIARNRCLDVLKTHSRRAELIAERTARIAEATIGTASTSAPSAEPPESGEALEEALGTLTPLEAETIRLTFLEDWTTRQIADLQACSPATVRVRRHQALERLRAVLAGSAGFTDLDIEGSTRERMNRHG